MKEVHLPVEAEKKEEEALILRLILGDQLNENHSWFREVRPDVVYAFMEVRSETDYVVHHIQKVLGIFAAMRSFAQKLKVLGHRVVYLAIDHPENKQSFEENIRGLRARFRFSEWTFQEAEEHRLDGLLHHAGSALGMPFHAVSSEHFVLERKEIETWFPSQKSPLMERFYRKMRQRTGYLMEGAEPESGRWNFDLENRSSIPKNVAIPEPLLFENDLSEIARAIEKAGIQTLSSAAPEKFYWPIDRAQSLELLEDFAERLLPCFGTFQDALSEKSWSLWHSRLAFSMNLKMLSPAEVIERCISAYRAPNSQISLAQIEGFVRQILGWREYVRGIYWSRMPGYAELNFFEANRPLPVWYWTGKTRMKCMSQAIEQTLEHAYAHHIQRLMLTGNFGLMAGISPDEMDRWYLGVYIDAFEWVEMPNTRGMSQFADGGIMATKPYAASANYLKKQGAPCSSCFYDPNDRVGEKACPFNSLYWNFIERNRVKLERNPRMSMIYRSLEKMKPEDRAAFADKAERLIDQIDAL